ncbi:hypothetical protein EU527_05710 [Candidatus Thorarchaeota archaeon]|nr:MAG: hypothetical protein EU527_05710 [Candidatus Thorarchaeota archaeon]
MILEPTWKLVNEDSSIDEFIDIRRIVGNQIIRAYLLEEIIKSDRLKKIGGKLRGPKNEFKDFSNFLIIKFCKEQKEVRVLVETGVYDNLRIVGTDSVELSQESRDDLIKLFTDALEHPESNNTRLIISNDSKLR